MSTILSRNFLITFLEKVALEDPNRPEAMHALSVARNTLDHDGATCSAADCRNGEVLSDAWLIIEGSGATWYLCSQHKQAAIALLFPDRPGFYGSGVFGEGVYGDTGAFVPVEEN